ncbi:PREDICTED: wall-associated receptor kinase 1-like isoform X1 [Camelina sativa]|uniref:Wall-associated receptor kinase 1-like isoform X1 n=1 Tax=Camelina sativa TaxID=90675 RepID=A0ABM0WX12_CAMSA|nr:PREDICTED: wall-associated receptor kinase 1-like isoform X1 [Camelina sativa]
MKLQEGLFLVVIFCLSYTLLVKGQTQHQPRKDCQTKCGNVKIEYPFGISSGCYYPGNESFSITCKEDRPHVLRGLEVKNFYHRGQIQVLLNVSSSCSNAQGNETLGYSDFTLDDLSLSANNKFTVVGCNVLGIVSSSEMEDYSTGCMSVCNVPPPKNGKCDGVGCCRTNVSFPLDSYTFGFFSGRIPNMTSVDKFNPCTYAFLVEDDEFIFSSLEDLKNLRNETQFPVSLDWSIGNKTCEQAGSTRICGGNSTCSDSTTRGGYICTCNQGFDGNPYILDGCRDINECTTSNSNHKHNCSDPNTCRNRDGGFDCKCRSGYRLDTTTMSCKRKNFGWAMILLVTTIVFLVILLGVSFIQHKLRRRKDTELRQQFFEKNGGGMLIQRLSGAGPSNADVKIFTEEGMKEATNGYDESRILGQGGQGTVYKGILLDNSVVAIKKARLGDRSQVEQFINEVLVLSQINHRNVVKLLGCCLETEVPLLVYEFINSGTLFDHLHGSLFDSSLTWEHRLRIAVEVAGTLAYLHSSASIPIIHRDVKTANILLDDNLTAKVADFGASRLIPMDQEQLTTMVQGTLGYLDPEYYNTGLLNEKSDVYSFGVVLMELLSGQKALCFERLETSKHLVSYFVSAMKEDRLHEIIDGQVLNEYNEKEIQEATRIALECTRLMGEERPKMKEVAAELEALTVKTTKHKWSNQYTEENEQLIGGHILSAQGDTSSTGYDSIKNVAILDIEAGR